VCKACNPRHSAPLFVDGVSSIASLDFRMDEWGVDGAISGSQKGFMLPAGLAILAFSQKALALTETATLSKGIPLPHSTSCISTSRPRR
jgi:alanine-glyoxylate transaminase/serine-glyoxylate transaminase/serine-pyruvate transaminase